MANDFFIADPTKLQQFLLRFSSQARRRGISLCHQCNISDVYCAEPEEDFQAEIEDRGWTREVGLFLDEHNSWYAQCSCNHMYCAHAYALGLFLLESNDLGNAEFTPAPPKKKPASATPKPKLLPKPEAPEDGLAVALAKSLNRPLNGQELNYLHTLGSLYTQCQYNKSITRWHFSELGFRLPGYSWDALKIWPEFPKDLRTFWLYIARAAADNQLKIPQFMEPLTDLKAIETHMRDWKRQQEIARWRRQMEQSLQSVPHPANHIQEEVDLRLCVSREESRLEYKTASMADFKPLPTKLARQFSEQLHFGELRLLPEAELLWLFFDQHIQYGGGASFHNVDIAYHKLLSRVLRRLGLDGRVVAKTGAPFTREPLPLAWSLEAPKNEDGDYQLRLVRTDGSAVTDLFMVIQGQPPLYLTDTSIYTGPPMDYHVLIPDGENRIPAPALESVAGVQFLDKLRIEPPARVQAKVQRMPLRVTIAARLHAPYGRDLQEFCVFQVLASSEDGCLREKWDGQDWKPEKTPGQKARKADNESLIIYDRAAQQSFPGLLQPLQLWPDPLAGGLACRVTKKFPELFSSWLKSLPKHIELKLEGELASLAQDIISGRVRLEVEEAEIDWFDLKVVVDVADTELTEAEIKLLLNAKGGFVRLEGKGWRRMAFDLTEEDDEQLARLGLNPHELNAEPQRLHALQLADKSARKFLPEAQAAKIERRAEEIKTRVTPPLPVELQASLRPYQIDGYHFLAYLSANRFGGILADDMGLGKTLQALAWLLWLRAQPDNGSAPTLVVCPKSVVDNWLAEAARFAPGLKIKAWQPDELEQLPEAAATAEVHVINYSQLRLLGETLTPLSWLAVILDEGQYIKNPSSQTAQVARALRASHRLILSGTPIENRLEDLWSLMAFAMPGLLGSRAMFGRHFNAKRDPLARRRLSARVRPFLLRRTKKQVAKDLPDKIEEDLFCEIEDEQKQMYRAELKYAQQLLLKVKTQKQLDKQRFNFLASLLRLRQICCHPALVKTDSKAESAKVNALLELLEPLMEEGEKVLVFSQFVELLELLRPIMENRGWPSFWLSGATENRGELVSQFQKAEGPGVFLISLKAGGFGLNLTAASYVVLCDPWWNPAVESQAIDRTHRIGQTEKVIAYRLLIKGSVEEKIRALQRQKSALAEDILGEEKFSQSLSLDDLKTLFAET